MNENIILVEKHDNFFWFYYKDGTIQKEKQDNSSMSLEHVLMQCNYSNVNFIDKSIIQKEMTLKQVHAIWWAINKRYPLRNYSIVFNAGSPKLERD